MSAPVSGRVAKAYVFLVGLLALSGIMQMPIASRYRIATIPGLAWLGDFWLTHKLHYLGAVGLLTLTSYVATRWILEWRHEYALTPLGVVRTGVVLLLILTGAVRVLKNLPDISFAPDPTMWVDWAHLGLALLLGLVALTRLVFRARYAAQLAPEPPRPDRFGRFEPL